MTEDIVKIVDELEKEKEKILNSHFKKYDVIKERIKFFCDKYNGNFDTYFRNLFSFKNKYNQEAFNTFQSYMYYPNRDNKKNIFSSYSKDCVFFKFEEWKNNQKKNSDYMVGYNFDEEIKAFNNMTDFFEFYVDLITLFEKYNKDINHVLNLYKYTTYSDKENDDEAGNIVQTFDQIVKNKEKFLKEFYKKCQTILNERITFFCNKYNVEFEGYGFVNPNCFCFKDEYRQKAYEKFLKYQYLPNRDNVENVFSKESELYVLKLYDKEKHDQETTLKCFKYSENIEYYDFEQEKKEYYNMMDFFKFVVDYLEVIKKYQKKLI